MKHITLFVPGDSLASQEVPIFYQNLTRQFYEQGDLMNKKNSQASMPVQSRPTSEIGIDYSPKAYSSRDQFVFGVKFISIAGIVIFLFWVIGKYI